MVAISCFPKGIKASGATLFRGLPRRALGEDTSEEDDCLFGFRGIVAPLPGGRKRGDNFSPKSAASFDLFNHYKK